MKELASLYLTPVHRLPNCPAFLQFHLPFPTQPQFISSPFLRRAPRPSQSRHISAARCCCPVSAPVLRCLQRLHGRFGPARLRPSTAYYGPLRLATARHGPELRRNRPEKRPTVGQRQIATFARRRRARQRGPRRRNAFSGDQRRPAATTGDHWRPLVTTGDQRRPLVTIGDHW